MNKHGVTCLIKQYWEDKAAGVKREPLHTLRECYEAAGITCQRYAKLCRKYPGAPAPRLVTTRSTGGRPVQHFRKKEVLAYIAQCLKAEENF